MCEYLQTKFQVSRIILTSFRQGAILPPNPKGTPKKPTQILGCAHWVISSRAFETSDILVRKIAKVKIIMLLNFLKSHNFLKTYSNNIIFFLIILRIYSRIMMYNLFQQKPKTYLQDIGQADVSSR